MISLFVPGIPRPGGSKTATVIRRKGGAIVMTKAGRPLVVTREAGTHTAAWRSVVSLAVTQHMRERGLEPILEGPIQLTVTFILPRPKSHYLRGAVRQSAPAYHTSAPDATKLLRSTEDALRGIAWTDDAQIARQAVQKRYGISPGAEITIEPIASADALPLAQGFSASSAALLFDRQQTLFAVPTEPNLLQTGD